MAKVKQVEQPAPVIPMLRNDFVSVLLLGAAIGLLIWIIGTLLNTYVFDTYLCRSDVARDCGNAKNYAVVVASVIGGIVALAGLIRLRVYRPLLVLVASLLSTWGIVQLSWNFGWFTSILVVILLFALAFGAYSWIARLREFWMTLIITLVLVVAVRLALMA